MAVTITDVARAAGVSASTVSRALSRPERVDAATRAAIMEQIAAARVPAQPGGPQPDHRPHRQPRRDRAGPGQPVLPGRGQGHPGPRPPAQPDHAAGRLRRGPGRRAGAGPPAGPAGRRARAVRAGRLRRRAAGRPAARPGGADQPGVGRDRLGAGRQRRRGRAGRAPPARAGPPADRLRRRAARPAARTGSGWPGRGPRPRRTGWSWSSWAASRPSFEGGMAAADSVLLAEVPGRARLQRRDRHRPAAPAGGLRRRACPPTSAWSASTTSRWPRWPSRR